MIVWNYIFAAILLVSLIANIIFASRINRKKPDGLLNVDTRDPEKDYYDFVFLIPIEDISNKKYLNVEVHKK